MPGFDYCPAMCRHLNADHIVETISLTGKIAALYGERSDDSVALSAVDEIESLTTDLSRKIWQKIMIVHQNAARCQPQPEPEQL